jgi:hypothetical protein
MCSSFSTWSAEHSSPYPHEVADHCLAHRVGNQVSRAYQRGRQYEKRSKLVQLWADYPTGNAEAGGNVLKLTTVC